MSKILIILLISTIFIFDKTQSSERYARQSWNGYQPNFYPGWNGNNNRNNGPVYPGFFNPPIWNQQPQFQPFPFPFPNNFPNQGGLSSRTNVKKSSGVACTYTYNGNKRVEKCVST